MPAASEIVLKVVGGFRAARRWVTHPSLCYSARATMHILSWRTVSSPWLWSMEILYKINPIENHTLLSACVGVGGTESTGVKFKSSGKNPKPSRKTCAGGWGPVGLSDCQLDAFCPIRHIFWVSVSHMLSDLIHSCTAFSNPLFLVTFITPCDVERKGLIIFIHLIS